MAQKKRGKPGSRKATQTSLARERERAPAAEVPLLDRRALERTMADLHALVAERQFETVEEMNQFLQGAAVGKVPPRAVPETALGKAQALMYDAFEAQGPQRVVLARRALAISPDCADAYVLLAEEEAQTWEEARELYAQGVAAGERALGPEAFEELKGKFWGWLETRPYMRAREGLALCLWSLERREEAVAELQGMLELNPDDNQGVRLVLALWLLQLQRNEELAALLKRFAQDESLELLWAKALWTFRAKGPGVGARRCFRAAFRRNPWVVGFLVGVKPLPEEEPGYLPLGGEEEGASAARALIPVLLGDQESTQWFVAELKALAAGPGGQGVQL